MFIISSFIPDLCSYDDDKGDGRCVRSKDGVTDGKGTTNNNRRAEQDRERVWYEDKWQNDKSDESLQEWKQMLRW